MRAREPERFAVQPAKPIAPNRSAVLARHGQAQAQEQAASNGEQTQALAGATDVRNLEFLNEGAPGLITLGGAALVFAEMTCVSADARITPYCPGMYAPEHTQAWKRIVDFVHVETDAKICCQLGHSGAKGSTQLGWEDADAPLKRGNCDYRMMWSAPPI